MRKRKSFFSVKALSRSTSNKSCPLTLALREAIVTVGAAVAVVALVVDFTWALSTADLTHAVERTVDVTVAHLAARPPKVTHVAPAMERSVEKGGWCSAFCCGSFKCQDDLYVGNILVRLLL